MLAFIISISIAFSIFCVISSVVILRRRQRANQNVGYIINDGGTRVMAPGAISQTHYQQGCVPVTHYTQGGVPVTQYTQQGVPVIRYPPPAYQPNGYPYPTSTQLSVQLTASPGSYTPNPPMQQRVINDGNANGAAAAVSVLPDSDEKKPIQQTHLGAVETVSQI